ncbi:uncharacterized protein IL334_006775 [Kwoniella shivajii]|uniref:Kri1-like C-terminal domain-containing protein n=1 Tax=Kwoniella shivajii TaxID=564305 RepID=A0ABZ1D913_9TREE|nr:hypothetical protein IL334_006775 [Kwoniella shivajii]
MQASISRIKPIREALSGSESGSESDYSSSDVTEDEDGAELTPALDAAILRTLSKIKKKEGVYGTENVLQEELQRAQARAEAKGIKTGVTRKAEKPFLLQDYHRAKLLSGDNNDEDTEASTEPLTYVQSRRLMQEEAISAFQSLADGESDEEGDFIKKRDKNEGEEEQDDDEYRQFLLEMGGGEDEVRKILGMGDQPISGVFEASDIEDGKDQVASVSKVEKKEIVAKKKATKEKKAKKDDEFLMNYILNRGWIDRSDDHVPTYKEVVGNDVESEVEVDIMEKSKAGPSSHPWGELDEEDEFDDKADAFEAEYNFRFEEPGSSNILSHPRQIDSLVRRPDDARKSKRARKAERKAAERAAQEENKRSKKGSKRREMEKRMASLKADLAAEGVEGEVNWDSLEKVLDGEWNEGEWEKVVGGMLSRAGEKEDEDGKPTWDDDLGDAEYDEIDGQGEGYADEGMDVDIQYDQDEDDGPINMDADFVEEEPTKKKRKKDKKKKNRAVSPEIATPDDSNLTVADKAKAVKEAMEEYRALDHEDIIGDLPTKFKYTQAAPTSFGLTPVEILLATDEELNKVLSVKSIAPYKKGGIGMQGRGLGARVRELKDEVRKRRWGQEVKPWKENAPEHAARRDGGGDGGGEDGERKRSGKRKGKKERQKAVKSD